MLVRYNGADYAYQHNLQGDILSLVDMDGTVVVEYAYDAWGKPISTAGSMAETLGHDNPFRYRGYVWDEETGLYYLRSRYYDPAWGRFVNADTLVGKVGALLSHNGFAYCSNSPTDSVDPDGKAGIAAAVASGPPGWFIAAVVGLLLLAANARSRTVARQVSNSSGAIAVPAPRATPVPAPAPTAIPVPTTVAQPIPIPYAITTPAPLATTRPRRVVVFPENPYDFKPLGLAINHTINTPANGLILIWGVPGSKTAVFEWNEDFEYGSHYHIPINNKHTGDHLRPGTPVPEPYATIYFPY